MPSKTKIRHCLCGHPYYLHLGASSGLPKGRCTCTVRNKKGIRVPCECQDYDHDEATGKFG